MGQNLHSKSSAPAWQGEPGTRPLLEGSPSPQPERTSRLPRGWRSRSILAAAARVNLMVVVPVTLLLFSFAQVQTWERLWRVGVLVAVVSNCNLILLTLFKHAIWTRFSFRSRILPYVGLAVIVLPLVALTCAGAAWAILTGIAPFDVPPFRELLEINLPLVIVYGVSYFVMSDYRRREAGLSADLSSSRRMHGELMLERDELKLFALQIFLNPHFLFNALNTIVSLIPEDPKKAEAATLGLARVLRRILETRDLSLVPLKTELAIVTDYLALEKIRLGERLTFSIDVPEELMCAEVPAMVVQPLVENAVKHGIRQRPGGGGHVRVRAWTTSGKCHLEVIDDGPGFSSHHGTGQARRLLTDRLAVLYGKGKFEMSLVRDDARGETVAGLCLPLRTELRTAS